MKTCQLFGDQCFKRNMVYTIATLSVTDFYMGSTGYFFSPSQLNIFSLAGRLYGLIPWQHRDANIYYTQASQAQTATRELRCCLFVFEN